MPWIQMEQKRNKSMHAVFSHLMKGEYSAWCSSQYLQYLLNRSWEAPKASKSWHPLGIKLTAINQPTASHRLPLGGGGEAAVNSPRYTPQSKVQALKWSNHAHLIVTVGVWSSLHPFWGRQQSNIWHFLKHALKCWHWPLSQLLEVLPSDLWQYREGLQKHAPSGVLTEKIQQPRRPCNQP